MFESCLEIRDRFSEYVDNACSKETRRSLRYHLSHCGACRRELERYELMIADLGSLPRRRLPAFAELRMQVALSRARHAHTLASLQVRLENALRPLLLPASGAVLAGVLCLGLTFDCLVVPATTKPDVPLLTPPRIESLAPLDFNGRDQSVVVVTHVDAGGRVVDYEVVSGDLSPELKTQLDRLLYFSVFRPATLLGNPTNGEAVLWLRRITVRGWKTHAREGAVKPSPQPAARDRA
jgi:Putative zinc-finger